jgi:cytochrome c oxidase assembly factor CtaG
MTLRRALAAGVVAALALPSAASAHGGTVPMSQLDSSWHADAAVVAPACVLAVLFAQAFVRLRRRGRADHAGFDRALLFTLALAIGTLALLSPLDATGEHYLLSAHMLQHMLIGDAAPALALVALRGPLLFFLVPPVVLGPLARLAPLRATLAWLLRPAVSVALWAVVFAVWHIPRLYDETLGHQGLHDLEHALFVLAGLAVWTQIIDPSRRGKPTVPQRIAIAVGLFAAGQILSYVLIFSFQALYPAYADQPARVFGWSPLLDQQLAGVAMMVEQLLTLGTAVALLLVTSSRRHTPVAVGAFTRAGTERS